ncbi:MAG: DUF389 domain-containing protein [Streptococcus thermophilus]
MIARTSPTIWDVLIAIGWRQVSLVQGKRSKQYVPGVAIATALMPPACTAGYGLANGNVRFYQLLSFLYQLCLYHANQYCWNKNYDETIS